MSITDFQRNVYWCICATLSIIYGNKAMAQRKYVLQESGSVTLPADFRKKYDLHPGDEIVFIETENDLLISPREIVIQKLLDDPGHTLRGDDLSVDDLM